MEQLLLIAAFKSMVILVHVIHFIVQLNIDMDFHIEQFQHSSNGSLNAKQHITYMCLLLINTFDMPKTVFSLKLSLALLNDNMLINRWFSISSKPH